MLRKNLSILLFLILLGAFAVRLPGIFWGFKIDPKPHLIEYHIDEHRLAKHSRGIFRGASSAEWNYPVGYNVQVVLAATALNPFREIDIPDFILIGRFLSLLYATLTVCLIFFLSKEIFRDHFVALFSGVLLALSGLHVTQSHYATVDVSATFWLYATIYSSLRYVRTNKIFYQCLAVLAAGTCLAFKLCVLAVIPIFYILIKKRLKFIHWALILGGLVIVFVAASGGRYTFGNLLLTIENVHHDNLNVILKNNKMWNPFIYFVELLPGLGLASFILLSSGIFFLRKKLSGKMFNNDLFFILILPICSFGILICCLDVPFPRHSLPLIPALVMVAAYGLGEFNKKITHSWFLLILVSVILYQLVYVAAVEYYYVFDTRESAEQWIKRNIPRHQTIKLMGHFAIMPYLTEYKKSHDDPDLLVMHETSYFRYLRSEVCPFRQYPDLREVYHGRRAHLSSIQRIFKGESPFKLIKRFPVRYITPESYLYKKIWGTYQFFIGDTLILQSEKISMKAI